MKLIQSYFKLESRICYRCGKMDNDFLCEQCRYCGQELN